MNLSKQLCILAVALALGACGEKKLDEPIPEAWAKADCVANADKTVVTEAGRKCAPGRQGVATKDKATP